MKTRLQTPKQIGEMIETLIRLSDNYSRDHHNFKRFERKITEYAIYCQELTGEFYRRKC